METLLNTNSHGDIVYKQNALMWNRRGKASTDLTGFRAHTRIYMNLAFYAPRTEKCVVINCDLNVRYRYTYTSVCLS